jgi:hypothetical protein
VDRELDDRLLDALDLPTGGIFAGLSTDLVAVFRNTL